MFDPVQICAVLNDEGVEYVVIGGFATVIHGSSLPTQHRRRAVEIAEAPRTVFGDLDLTFQPSGGLGGFVEWNDNATTLEISEGLTVRVAARRHHRTEAGR